MPARGRHRRYKAGPVSRASLTVTASSAGLALPLVGAGLAHAAGEGAERTVQAEEAAQQTVREPAAHAQHQHTQPAPASSAHTQRRDGNDAYDVVGGDTLSSIAQEHDVAGGWHGLYERNRRVVGGDPDLIFPGQRLSLEDRQAPPKERRRPREESAEESGHTAGSPGKHTPPEDKESKQRPERGKPAPAAPRASAPVTGAGTGTPYRAAGSGWSSGYHTGVDFPVPTGTTVKAVSGGSVVSAGWAGAYGYQVVLRHDDGRYSQYAHLSAISVSDGQRVGVGQRVGRSGSTGNSTGPHLHFEVRTGPGYGSDIDPLAYLRGLGVTL